MKVLITGAAGQVGRALVRSAPRHIEVVALTRHQLDLLNFSAVERWLDKERPDVVLNAAAYTAVDQAEADRARAFSVNAEAVGILGRTSSAIGARLIHVSTDFVFDGKSGRPYAPDDVAAPINVYGQSKLCGEHRLMSTEGLEWVIVRTAWVYSGVGRNFLLTMLKLMRERERVSVVCDQVGTPTSARSLATVLWQVALDSSASGIFHYTDAGVASWYDFAMAIYEEACTLGLLNRHVDVVPIRTDQYSAPARRPSYSVLDVSETVVRLGLKRLHWRVALRETMKELCA
jgi:dTDP-4-dehydrorhamnose reductase